MTGIDWGCVPSLAEAVKIGAPTTWPGWRGGEYPRAFGSPRSNPMWAPNLGLTGIDDADALSTSGAEAFAALGVPLGSPDGRMHVAAYRDVVAAIVPWGFDPAATTGDVAVTMVRRRIDGDEVLTARGLAGRRAKWLSPAEVEARRTAASAWPGMRALAGFVEDVAAIEGFARVEATARASEGGSAVVRATHHRQAVGGIVRAALLAAAGAVPAGTTWSARRDAYDGVAAGWAMEPPSIVREAKDEPGSATMGAVLRLGSAAARDRALAHLEGIPGAARVRDELAGRWLARLEAA